MSGVEKPAWLDALDNQKFFRKCSNHKKAKKNVFWLDCCSSICRYCVPVHRLHRLLYICQYAFQDVVGLEDLQKFIDCSSIQAYTSAKVVFIKKRPLNRRVSSSYCTTCDRALQEPFIHCSLECKVDYLTKHEDDLTPYVKTFETSQLSPANDNDHPMSPTTTKGINSSSSGSTTDSPGSTRSSDSGSSNMEAGTSNNISSSNKRTRSRKGIPRRAPFF